MSERTSIVAAHQFLRKMPAAHAERMAALATHVTFPARQMIFEEGTPARKFWLIDAGQAELEARVPGNGRVIIEELGRGDLLGLSWLQPPYQWQYGAIATQPVQAFEFEAAAVREAMAADPEFGFELMTRLMAVAAHRLNATRARLLQARVGVS